MIKHWLLVKEMIGKVNAVFILKIKKIVTEMYAIQKFYSFKYNYLLLDLTLIKHVCVVARTVYLYAQILYSRRLEEVRRRKSRLPEKYRCQFWYSGDGFY